MFALAHFSGHPSRGRPCLRLAAVLTATAAFTLLGLSPATAQAANPGNHAPLALSAAAAQPDRAAPAQFTPLLANWLDRVLDPVISGLTGRRRMIQVGALVMLLALAIIWWRK